jgi:hypothetical protein
MRPADRDRGHQFGVPRLPALHGLHQALVVRLRGETHALQRDERERQEEAQAWGHGALSLANSSRRRRGKVYVGSERLNNRRCGEQKKEETLLALAR